MALFRRGRMAPVHVRLFGRPGCGLCDDAERWLRAEGRRVILETVDVSTDPDLERRYGMWVPVVEIEGHVRLKARFDRSGLVAEVRRAGVRPAGRAPGARRATT